MELAGAEGWIQKDVRLSDVFRVYGVQNARYRAIATAFGLQGVSSGTTN